MAQIEIKNIYGETMQFSGLRIGIDQANECLGIAWAKYHKNKGVHTDFITSNGITKTHVQHYSYILNELLKQLQPLEFPDWCFRGGFPTCIGFCDTRKEERGDYKSILRLFYSPLRIEISAANKKAYPEILELAKEQLTRLKIRCNEPLVVTASGQATGLTLSSGPDVVIVK